MVSRFFFENALKTLPARQSVVYTELSSKQLFVHHLSAESQKTPHSSLPDFFNYIIVFEANTIFTYHLHETHLAVCLIKDANLAIMKRAKSELRLYNVHFRILY